MTKQLLTVAALLAGILGATMGMAADETPVNLALGKSCKVFSSIEANGSSTAALTDGKRDGAGWCGKAFPAYADHRLYPEFIVVDLGQNYSLNRIELFPVADGSGFPEDFTLQVCREGEPWKPVVQKHDYPAPANGSAQVFGLPDCEGRYVKIEATRLRQAEPNMFCFKLAEVEVYGAPREAEPLAAKAENPQVPTRVTGLRCEHFVDPVGVDAEKPRLDWIMESSRRGERQTACRILVASDRKNLDADQGDLWDSGKIENDRSVAVRYGGQPLKSGQQCFWKVMVWDKAGQPIPWSEPARFITGKMKPEDWKGQWVGAPTNAVTDNAAIYLRKVIEVEKPVKRAIVFFCGLGHSQLSIDGVKVGDGVLTPGFTTYNKRVQYLAYDVTDRFARPGAAVLGAVLVDGWYGRWPGAMRKFACANFYSKPYVDRPKMLLDLQLEFADGSTRMVSSDLSWKWSRGEIIRSFLCAEDIDRRAAQPGWDRMGFDDTKWNAAAVLKAPAGRLLHQQEPQTRISAEYKPLTIIPLGDNKWRYDFGREINGALRFRASGPAGTKVKLTVIPSGGNAPPRIGSFTLAGQGVEEYIPQFCYGTLGRVEVAGAIAPPKLDDLSAVEITGVGDVSGEFRCSNDLLNWLHESARRTQKAYVTFAPHDTSREYQAYSQDQQNMFASAVYLYDSRAMYERWQRDFLDGQAEGGDGAIVAPGPVCQVGAPFNGPWWGGCIVWLPWHWYQQFGDPSLLAESYEGMKRYLDHLTSVGEDYIQTKWQLGDWYPAEGTSPHIVNTAGYYLLTRFVSQTAEILGRAEDAKKYADLAQVIRTKFNAKFLNAQTGAVVHGRSYYTQASQSLALALGLIPDSLRNSVEAKLLAAIAARKDHVGSGFVATPYLLEVLSDLAPEAGYRMTTKQTMPSWYAMTAGSNHDLMQEQWWGTPVVMPSLGGNIAGWHMRALAGIRPDPAGPGFKKIIIKPAVVGDLHWVEGWYDSVHGRIVSNWRRRAKQVVMEVSIPANTTATVYVPARSADEVTESGQPASKVEGVKFLKMDHGAAVYEIGSGRYRFRSPEYEMANLAKPGNQRKEP